MEKSKEVVSSGSSTSHGSPIEIDYRALLGQRQVKKDRLSKEYATAKEIATLMGISGSHARKNLLGWRDDGSVEALLDISNGVQAWFYKLSDVCKVLGLDNA